LLLPPTPHRQHAVDAVLSFLGEQDAAVAAAARRFVARALKIDAHELALNSEVSLLASEVDALNPLLQRLKDGEPLAYVEGTVGFYKHEFIIDHRALIPRADSEVVVELCLDSIHHNLEQQLLDVGTGSGCLLLSLLAELPLASGVAIDVEQPALDIAALNAQHVGVADRINFVHSDCLARLSVDHQFDLIVSNPPYIVQGEKLGNSVAEHEPHSALFVTNGDPMQFYSQILCQAKKHLVPHGVIVFEIGANREQDLALTATENGYQIIEQRQDLSGIVRAISLRLLA
jgi:release factor glutamine methyltransferase